MKERSERILLPRQAAAFGEGREIFGGVSEDFLGGTGKAEDAKLPSAGIIPEAVPYGEGMNGDNEPKQRLAASARTKADTTVSSAFKKIFREETQEHRGEAARRGIPPKQRRGKPRRNKKKCIRVKTLRLDRLDKRR